MPTTLKLKNIPDEIYERLEASAKVHGRTMSDEAIACLETLLLSAQISALERLVRIRAIRADARTRNIDHRHVDEFKRGSRH
jgi:antitoxin FitA